MNRIFLSRIIITTLLSIALIITLIKKDTYTSASIIIIAIAFFILTSNL